MAISNKDASTARGKHEVHRDELAKRIPVIESEIERIGALLAGPGLSKAERSKLEAQLRHQKKTLSDTAACLDKEEILTEQEKAAKAKAERRKKALEACYSELLVRCGMSKSAVDALTPARRKDLARKKAASRLQSATGGALVPKGNRDSMVLECVGHLRANETLARYYAPKLTLRLHLQYKKELISMVSKAAATGTVDGDALKGFLKEITEKDEMLKEAKRKNRSAPSSKKLHALNNRTHWVRY